MFESKYNKLLTVILVIVVIAIIGLLTYLGVSFFSEKADTDDAAAFVDNYNFDDTEPGEETPQEPENPDDENPLEQTSDEGENG